MCQTSESLLLLPVPLGHQLPFRVASRGRVVGHILMLVSRVLAVGCSGLVAWAFI
jgi:hypothetical protein